MARLTVIIPARNEAETLRDAIWAIRSRMAYDVYILVVDDHSTDQTGYQARIASADTVIANERAPGYGNAISLGIRATTTPRLTIMTADGSDDTNALPRYAAMEDLVFGKRTLPPEYPQAKRVLNRVGNRLIAAQRRVEYDDWTDPFKAYPTTLAQSCLPLVNNMSAGLELALKASQQRPYQVVPVQWRGREDGQSKFRWREPFLYLQTAWRWA